MSFGMGPGGENGDGVNWRGSCVLMLSCFVGQALLKRGSKVTFTDQSQMLALLKRNIEENFGKGILKDTDTGELHGREFCSDGYICSIQCLIINQAHKKQSKHV